MHCKGNRNSNFCHSSNSRANRKRGQKYANFGVVGTLPEKSQNDAILNVDQLHRLYAVMHEQLEVHGTGNFPTLLIGLRRFIHSVTKRMADQGLPVKRVKLNGSTASYVLATKTLPYNDIDLIFSVDMSGQPPLTADSSAKFDVIKRSVFESLIDFLPPDASRTKISACAMKVAYVRKMVKVCDARGDLWSLISLNNDQGRFLELKFVDRMRRQFEFSVDSFQIDLGPIVRQDESRANAADGEGVLGLRTEGAQSMDGMQVTAESLYGNFQLALKHLNNMLIDTVQPEMIRGGGLLKYVNLLVKGYRPACSAHDCNRMERYMCSRFFIDFGSWEQQQQKLRTYLDNHFQNNLPAMFDFLRTLYSVVDESTVCLMNYELRMSLCSIEQLTLEVHLRMCYEQQVAMINGAMALASVNPSTMDGNCHRCHRPSSAASTTTTGTCGTGHDSPSSDFRTPDTTSSIVSDQLMCNCSDADHPAIHKLQKPTLLCVPSSAAAAYWLPVM